MTPRPSANNASSVARERGLSTPACIIVCAGADSTQTNSGSTSSGSRPPTTKIDCHPNLAISGPPIRPPTTPPEDNPSVTSTAAVGLESLRNDMCRGGHGNRQRATEADRGNETQHRQRADALRQCREQRPGPEQHNAGDADGALPEAPGKRAACGVSDDGANVGGDEGRREHRRRQRPCLASIGAVMETAPASSPSSRTTRKQTKSIPARA